MKEREREHGDLRITLIILAPHRIPGLQSQSTESTSESHQLKIAKAGFKKSRRRRDGRGVEEMRVERRRGGGMEEVGDTKRGEKERKIRISRCVTTT
eukprot:767718-Hanusia_phi.AAC.1